ncbi:MAG: Lin1244/Lin1753 domain-containing protein [Acutalibacteraceae bacterium]
MARPNKIGLDYFPVDTEFEPKLDAVCAIVESNNSSIKRSTVVGTLLLIWQKIYKNGYYLDFDEDIMISFAVRDCGLGFDDFKLILDTFINKGIFDKTLYDECKILTSKGIQKQYLNIAKRRSVEIEKRYSLLSDDLKNINVDNNSVFADNNSINVSNNATKKIKENKSKENKIKLNENLINKFDLVRQKLREKYVCTTYECWFADLELVNCDDETITLSVRDKFKANTIIENYLDDIADIVREVFQKDYEVKIEWKLGV